MSTSGTGRRGTRVALNAAGILVFLFAVFPVFWMVSSAFKTDEDINSETPLPVPVHWTLKHFKAVIDGQGLDYGLFHFFLNSAIVALATVAVSCVISVLAAYAVARTRFRGRVAFLLMLLIVQMVPLEALMLPLMLNAQRMHLLNSLSGVIVVYVGSMLAFSTLMLRGFVAAVPKDLEEAASIDGASRFTTFWRITFPLVAPGLVATSIFSFVNAWNEFVIAFAFLKDQDKYMLPLTLSYSFGRTQVEWGSIMASSTLFTIPVMVFFLIVQRRMVSGLVAGAVKG
ncbi:carbohydrate ABC transporter permease [Actinomadura rupiterrae]|uniref:carbohydrate ABC transporter permease n=1 Tax=Actinomadura rupiterrae TaxID=559627 RepID=UPI0020A55501|nr:carbohydrate ABC transporter permease [Actinomadura rupiterrae]MCP2338855.1 N,N'-diacetylchitobiose transport system permease protein [Actinomadura rupiterrae]